MPSNILTTDTSFPNLNGNQSTDEKFRLITNYLYMLLEQLRYSMANLGLENFNEKEFDDIVNLITDPVYVQLEDVEGNVASLTITAEQLISRMTDAEGNISSLQQTANSFRLQIRDLEGNVSSLQLTAQSLTTRISNAEGNISTLTQTANGLRVQVQNAQGDISTLQQTAGSLQTQITNASGAISSLTQTVNGFTFSVTNGDTSSVIRLMSGGAEITSATIQIRGMVTFSDLSGNGTTTINGANLMTGTVMASYLLGGTVGLLDASQRTVGGIDLAYTSSGDGLSFWTNRGGIRIEAAGNIWLESNRGSETLGLADGYITCGGDTMPRWDDRLSLGRSSYRWAQVYAASSEIVTSDRNLKNSITYDMEKYDAFFDRLRPTPYQYNDGTSGRTHLGMISQDVEDALAASGLTGMDFAGFVKGQDEDGGWVYSLRYEEFIALCVYQIQKLKARVAELEEHDEHQN